MRQTTRLGTPLVLGLGFSLGFVVATLLQLHLQSAPGARTLFSPLATSTMVFISKAIPEPSPIWVEAERTQEADEDLREVVQEQNHPGPQPFDYVPISETNCIPGLVKKRRKKTGLPKVPILSETEMEFCSSHAGEGSLLENGVFNFVHAKRCGHHWMEEEEICEMLQGWSVFFIGDSTSRRLALTLQSLLGGLEAASKQPFPSSVQLLPDAFRKYTDNIPRCIPRSRCKGASVAGVIKPEFGWQTYPGANSTGLFVSGETLKASKTKQDEEFAVSWQKSFFAPYTAQTCAQMRIWAPMVGDVASAIRFNKILVEQVEKMLPNHKTLMIFNAGSWHLQGPFPMLVPKGVKDPYNTNGVYRNRILKENKDYMDMYAEKLGNAFADADIKTLKRTLWVWRTMSRVNETHPRFKLETDADDEAISLGKIGKQARTGHGHDYSIPVNQIIERWNSLTKAQIAANKGWILADIYDATSQSPIDDLGAIHLKDEGRRIELQIILNAVRPMMSKISGIRN